MLIIEGDEYVIGSAEQTSTQVGLLFAELYEETSGAVSISRAVQDEGAQWTVKYKINDEWSTVREEELELALLVAIEDSLERSAK